MSALRELERPDPEHPDCWLTSEEGWSVAVFESGLVILENIATGAGPWHMRDVSKEVALGLWVMLQANDLVALQAKPWSVGYGSA
jgi:hypothetical protein